MLYKLLDTFSVAMVRVEVLNVIQQNRSVPRDEARNIKVLFPSEVDEILRRFK